MTSLTPDPRCFSCHLHECDDEHPACPVGADERAANNARQRKSRDKKTPVTTAKRRAYLNEYQRRNRSRITELQREYRSRRNQRQADEGAPQ